MAYNPLPLEAEPYFSKGVLPKGTTLAGEMSGWFNRNYVMEKPSGERVVLRIPKMAEETRQGKEYVEKEFGILGLSGGAWGFYSLEEQGEKALELESRGIPVLVPISGDGNSSLLYPFVNCKSAIYQDILSSGTWEEALVSAKEFLGKIGLAHSKGAVLGDRWGPNEFILPGKGALFFDFDERLLDPDFESAQATYYTLRYSKRHGPEFVKGIARDVLSMMRSGEGNPARAIGFLEMHGEYFRDWHPWGSSERETSLLIDELARISGR